MDRALVVAALLAAVVVVALMLRARGSRTRGRPRRVEPDELGLNGGGAVGVVGFSSPYCVPCRRWEEALGQAGIQFTKVDVSRRPDLARRYRISATPLVLAVRLPSGEVLESFHDEPRRGQVERLRELTA
jgi:Glutaredoxin